MTDSALRITPHSSRRFAEKKHIETFMDGNVGYLRFDRFANTLYAGDTAVAALQSWTSTYVPALEKIHEKTGPEGNKKQWLAWLKGYTEVKSAPVDVEAAVLENYAGTYGPAKIVFEKGQLWVIQPGRAEKEPLIAMTEDTFIIDGDPNLRIKFEKNEQGEVFSAQVLFFDGSSDRVPKKK